MGHRAVRPVSRIAIGAGFALAPLACSAHHESVGGASPGRIALETLLALLLVASAVGYAAGVMRLWRHAGADRGIRNADAIRFALGWTTVAAALFSPIDALADRSFALHMVQHELLMVVAAPLLAASRTFEAWAWALRGGRGLRTLAAIGSAWRWLAAPSKAWWLHAAALWLWHVPVFFAAALENDALHALQHLSFFGAALLFWWAVQGGGQRVREGTALVMILTTMLHMNALGLLLTFAPDAWFAQGEPPLFGLSALEDQQLGGLVMWMLGGMVYVAAGLRVAARWVGPRHQAHRT